MTSVTETTTKGFNPAEHLQKITGKDYLPVRWRLVWFHAVTTPRAGYCTFQLQLDRQQGFAQFLCVAWDGNDETWRTMEVPVGEVICKLQVCGRVAMGYGSETRADFADFPEKSETKAIGRAMAGLGFGTQFAPDLDEKHRIVDSPVERANNRAAAGGGRAGGGAAPERATAAASQAHPPASAHAQANGEPSADDEQPANEQQMASIRKLCAALGREEPDPKGLTVAGASALIRQLSREYNNSRRQPIVDGRPLALPTQAH